MAAGRLRFLVVPEILPRFVGPGPNRIGAPCRDARLAFSAATPTEVVLDLVDGLASLDPASLVPTCFHTGDRLPPITAVECERPGFVS